MNSIYTSDYKNKKIAGVLKEYCAKKYGRKREFVDAEITARLGMGVDESKLDQVAPEATPPVPTTTQETTTSPEITTPVATQDTTTQS